MKIKVFFIFLLLFVLSFVDSKYIPNDRVGMIEVEVASFASINEQLEDLYKIAVMVKDYAIGFTDIEVLRIAKAIQYNSQTREIDPRMIMSVILVESSAKKGQISYANAHGLMQVMPRTAKGLVEKHGAHRGDLMDPEYNIFLGSMYLHYLMYNYNDIRKALVAYNQGETVVNSQIKSGIPLPGFYSGKVLSTYKFLCGKYEITG